MKHRPTLLSHAALHPHTYRQGVFVSEEVGGHGDLARAVTLGVLHGMENWKGSLGTTELIQ